MRILHVLDHSIPIHSGYSFRTLSILREQRARGWETFHVTGAKQGAGSQMEETVDGWHFYRTPRLPSIVSGVPVLSELEMMGELADRVERLARKLHPHLLHAHSPVLNAIPALRVGRRLGLPVVYEVRALWEDAAVDHGTTSEGSLRYRATRALETYALKRADAVVTICEGLRSELVARGIVANRIVVVPNGVDVEAFSATAHPDRELKKSLGLDGCVVLGFVGSFYHYEGLGLLVSALPAIKQRWPRVKVLLVGGGSQESALKRQVAAMGLENDVVFVGRVPHEEVGRYYDLIDILVYARLSMRLTDLVTPLKPLEAMAQGRLVVASDVGGHRELMRHGETAIMFRAGDAEDLARKVVELLEAPQRWDQLKAAARKYVEGERSWKRCVAQYESVYSTIAEAEAAGA